MHLDIEDPQAEILISYCVTDAVLYTSWQAYQYEKVEFVPQPVEIVDDDMIDEFMDKVKEVYGYQEEWAERLKISARKLSNRQ
ncbi:Imm6 family immunity protein [Thermoactinomyces mirandus]|uniref:Imm6 family immunity protein n=1 Tax=Thermoactinomyces mirandus TaxID=2756294 RepID=UPI0028ABB154|nr:Imm6 family immunity protein [Thermoactinomyces mirandus]